MKKDDIKIYCRFNKKDQPIEEVIYKIFCDYAENKNVKKNSLHIEENPNNVLKQY